MGVFWVLFGIIWCTAWCAGLVLVALGSAGFAIGWHGGVSKGGGCGRESWGFLVGGLVGIG